MYAGKIRQVLMIILLSALIFFMGIQRPGFISNLTWSMVNQSIRTFLPGYEYIKQPEVVSLDQWLADQAVKNIFPYEVYAKQNTRPAAGIEDEETYQLILARKDNEKVISKKKTNTSNMSYEQLISKYYTVDSSTSVTEQIFNVKEFLKKDMSINENKKGPKVLIYHTHSQEAFADSKKGDSSETILGMGAYLAEILNKTYEIETLHHKGVYDLINGKMDRSKAYQLAKVEVEKILKDNPSIEVVIDLHRDGVRNDTHLVTEIDGKPVAQIMFFNGLSRTRINGDIEYLENPYIKENLAFSFQMQLKAKEKYPDFVRRIYLKSYRYNMHLMPKTLLIEAGAQTNTVEEMKNAMVLLAEILDGVLKP